MAKMEMAKKHTTWEQRKCAMEAARRPLFPRCMQHNLSRPMALCVCTAAEEGYTALTDTQAFNRTEQSDFGLHYFNATPVHYPGRGMLPT